MARSVSPNQNDVVEFDERIVDGDGDTLTVDSVELHQLNGILQSGADRTPGWLSYSTTLNTLSSGATELIVTIEIDSTQISGYDTYTLEIISSDPQIGATRYVDFNSRPPSMAATEIWVTVGSNIYRYNGDGSQATNGSVSDPPDLSSGWVDFVPIAAPDQGGVIIGHNNYITGHDPSLNQLWRNDDPANDVCAITVGTDGFIYVADTSGKIIRLNKSGDTIKTIAGTESYNRVQKDIIPIANSYIFFAEQDARRVYLIDDQGNEIWSDRVDSNSLSTGGHDDQDRLAVCRSERVYVYDRFGDVRWSSAYLENQHGKNLEAVAMDPSSNLLALGGGGNAPRLAVYDDNGNVMVDRSVEGDFGGSNWHEGSQVHGIQWDENQNIYLFVERQPDFGSVDTMYLAKYGPRGAYKWSTQVGTTQYDGRLAVPRFLG